MANKEVNTITIHNVGKADIVTTEGTVKAGSPFVATKELAKKLQKMYPKVIKDSVATVSNDVSKQIVEKQAIIEKKDSDLAEANKTIEQLRADIEAKAKTEETK